MNQETDFDRAEAYLVGSMTAEERQKFEADVAENRDLAAALAAQRLEHRAMELGVQQDLRAQFAAWDAEKLAATTTTSTGKIVPLGSSRRGWMRYAIAASVALLLGFFGKMWFFPSSSDDVLASYFMDETSLLSNVRSGNAAPEAEKWAAATDAIHDKNYEKAAAALAEITDSTDFVKARLMLGECQFRLKNWSAAVATFQEVQKKSVSKVFREQADWFLVLTYLAKGDEKTAFESRLNAIAQNSSHSFWKKANELKSKK